MESQKTYRKTPPRLERVFQQFDAPMYFVTFCTMWRQKLLANDATHADFLAFAFRGESHGVAVGRYVILPDHIHLFVRGSQEFVLGTWIRGLKRAMTPRLKERARSARVWQPGFFDHLMRGHESYSEKWDYVRINPVRAGLVPAAEEWPYQGEIVRIRF